MGMILNDEQLQLQDSVKKFIADRSPVAELRRLRDKHSDKGYDETLWQEMVEMGLPAIVLPEKMGGLDFGFGGLAVALMEAGRSLTASPLLATAALCAPILLRAASDSQCERILQPVASGQLTLALAVDEGKYHNPLQMQLQAKKTAEGWRLSGSKQFVIDGHSADQLLVAGRSGGAAGDAVGISLFLVDPEADGLTINRISTLDSRNAAAIEFDGVAAELIGSEGQGFAALELGLDCGRSALSAEMLGAALEVFERTLKYLREREQFGSIIGSFQGLKHRAARIFAALEMTRSLVIDSWEFADAAIQNGKDSAHSDFAAAASAAKASAGDNGMLAAREALQMHGGIGMTDELETGFYIKRMQISSKLLGDSVFHRSRYADFAGI